MSVRKVAAVAAARQLCAVDTREKQWQEPALKHRGIVLRDDNRMSTMVISSTHLTKQASFC